MKKIISTVSILFFMLMVNHSSASDPQTAQAAVVLKLQLPRKKNMMNLSIALAFTQPSEQPSYKGVRIVNEDISFHDKENFFGFRNGDGITHIKFPTNNVTIENEAYSYVEAGMDRQENGMFRLSRVPSDSSGKTYHLRGVFYAQDHLFIINEIIHFNEERICYSMVDQEKP